MQEEYNVVFRVKCYEVYNLAANVSEKNTHVYEERVYKWNKMLMISKCYMNVSCTFLILATFQQA